ncbi:cobalt-zinc-cadmium efflux system outer membrane protein [Ereboglobus sp. PH5-10]|uniref:Transporter n=1 Tax=Ereboglobus luteus TaxID=1796921 RepID=A0A2U8E510_9BACT|nr:MULTISPECIES: TolC family protein [Ereboglobus]AWI09644.1 transporter [Ereboglobus luteus]MDF9828081.1 cobalt-zinc-cadmium efflux system outer membrane protein [Ereboglobus sp. PH5-10]
MKSLVFSHPFRYILSPALLLAISSIACSLYAQDAPPAKLTESSVAALSLDDLVNEITLNNPERRLYIEELDASRVSARVAGRWSEPELGVDAGYKRLKDSSGTNVGDGMIWSVSITQTFEWPGRLSLRKAIASRQVELAKLGISRFENALASRARILAFGLYAANEKANAIREVSERFTSLKETFLARDPAGITPLLDTRAIEASELALRRRATEADLAVQAALVEINQLRGVPIDAPLRVKAKRFSFDDAPSTQSLLVAARENNFDYRMRQVELEQQGFAVKLARNERYPSVSVGPYISRDNIGDRETIVGLTMSVPLPVTGTRRAAVDIARVRQRQAEAAALVAQRELERDVVTAAQIFTAKLTEARQWTSDAAKKFSEAAELADRHYRMGAVTITAYIELQNSYLDAVEALLSTQTEALESGLKLQELTGINLNPVEVAQ